MNKYHARWYVLQSLRRYSQRIFVCIKSDEARFGCQSPTDSLCVPSSTQCPINVGSVDVRYEKVKHLLVEYGSVKTLRHVWFFGRTVSATSS